MDSQYQELPLPQGELDHAYGPQVHILSHPWAMSLLTRLCRPDTVQPQVDRLVSALYQWMLTEVASRVLLTETVDVPTRMATLHPEEARYQGQGIDPRQKVVVVDIARAGMLPAACLYNALHDLVDAGNLRQDHVIASRIHDEDGAITGVEVSTRKVGGPVAGATVLIPDPMAASGTSVAAVARRYLDDPAGLPRKLVVMHLIVTPEYLRNICDNMPEVEIFALRLDRGLSSAEVLATRPGQRWDEERGLNTASYIVPGAGGLGEVLNNAWV